MATVKDECVEAYKALVRLPFTYKYLTFMLTEIESGNPTIVIDKKGERFFEREGGPDATYDDFLESLGDNDCRYGVFNIEYRKTDRGRSTDFFMFWRPDTAPIKDKMMYQAAREVMLETLSKIGLGACIEARNKEEASYNSVVEQLD